MVVLLATPALIKVAYLRRLVDEPSEDRKVHKRRIPTIGGVMIFAGTLFGYLLWFPTDVAGSEADLIASFEHFKYIGACMLILFFIGVKDDIIGTAPVKKLLGHLLVAFVLVIMGNIRITNMYGLFGIYELPDWGSIFLSVFTYTVIVNAFNLIDGVDGLAAGIGAISCTTFGIWFYFAENHTDAVLSFALVGSLLGFLVFNFAPAKIFMGDSGSLTIGLIVSVLAIKMVEYPVAKLPKEMLTISKPVFAMAALFYPLVDTLRIFIYRASKGISPFAADRNHLHHRLLESGLDHGRTVITIYLASISIILLAVFVRVDATYSLAIVAGVSLVLSQIPDLLLRRKKRARRSLTQ